MSDFPIPMPTNTPAVRPMARTEKLLEAINEQQKQMLAVLNRIEENTRQVR